MVAYGCLRPSVCLCLFGQSSEGHAIPCSDYQQLSMILSYSRTERVNQHAYHSAETETESQPTELEVIWQMISKASSLSWWEPWQLLRRSSLCLSFAYSLPHVADGVQMGPDGKRIVIPSEIGQSVSRNRSIALSNIDAVSQGINTRIDSLKAGRMEHEATNIVGCHVSHVSRWYSVDTVLIQCWYGVDTVDTVLIQY